MSLQPGIIDMNFPHAAQIDDIQTDPQMPTFVRARYEPEIEAIDDPGAAARAEVATLPVEELEPGSTVAVGVGSRGIHDMVPVAEAVVEELQDRGFECTVVPAMGSHGGASPAGQLEILETLGITEAGLGCPIDARMDVESLGEVTVGDIAAEVFFSTAALEADAVLPINRVKAHTSFEGSFESGLCKMLVVGFGKQHGANAMHRVANAAGYEETIGTMLETILETVPILGGIALVENFRDTTATITAVSAGDLPGAEHELLEESYRRMASLPADEIDLLILDEIGKEISGTGMDTNVVGRYRKPTMEDPAFPDITVIYVRNLTEATKQNGYGIGLADLTRSAVTDEIDLQKVYANVLTSGSLSMAQLPVTLPDDRQALAAAATAMGAYSPERAKIAWVQNTTDLSEIVVSEPLFDQISADVEPIGREQLTFDGDQMQFHAVDR